MAEYIRRIVSGNKARFKDGNLNLELDLVYVTDSVIIMGYPASGLEGYYRNNREDAKKFLEHRHGKNFWVFNFCPIKENSYPASVFDGRTSRYPFPDHHAPPLAVMALVAREVQAWLSGGKDRVAVFHCKAGKGRSGTMACSYLLSLDDSPSPPKLERNHTAKELAKARAENTITAIPEDIEDSTTSAPGPEIQVQDFATDSPLKTDSPAEISKGPSTGDAQVPEKSFTDALKNVLDLHTSRRMKAPSSGDAERKQGVSIPSQRRWLYYWALLLAGEAPSHVWSSPAPNLSAKTLQDAVRLSRNGPKVRLTEVKLQMRELSGMKMNLVSVVNAVIDRTNLGKAPAEAGKQVHVWASLARYDDEFVDTLERWERYTRDDKHMGRRPAGRDHIEQESVASMFKDGKWDSEKMVRSFARIGALDGKTVTKEKDGKTINVYTLRPLSDAGWSAMREAIEHEKPPVVNDDEAMPTSESNSIYDGTGSIKKPKSGVVLDASREVRMKLYMGQVFMGWIWFVPTFHMPQPPPSSTSSAMTTTTTKILLTRKEIDFPLGLGSAIIDVEISLEWLEPLDDDSIQAVPGPEESSTPVTGQAAGLAATLAQGTVEDTVRTAQAVAD
ncbi:phosphatases II [Mycena floridula]|nr:phosphatases II [Mycena floridula]